MPLLPSTKFFQKVSRPFPTGVTTPRPVITTRRSLFIKKVTGESLFLARAHADALHGLEKFPFGFDRGRDDDFGLLKLGNVAGANVAHASRDRADEVLAAVINLGRPEKDLFQRTGGADLDPRPAREIHMRGRHSPMITGARRLLRASKRAAEHDCIRATRERFANVAALAHSAVSDDWDITRSFFEISVAGGGAIDRGGDLRHAQAKHAARSASCSGTDTDENASRTAFHNFQRDIVADGVADDDRDAHVGAKFCQIKRFVFGRDVSRGRDRALYNVNIGAGFLRDWSELGRTLRNGTDGGDSAFIFDLFHPRRDQIRVNRLLINSLQQ